MIQKDKYGLEQVRPAEIEKRSFEIITEELQGRTFPQEQESIIKRVIHTSADFEYADTLYFSEGAVAYALDALRRGACIVSDTTMVQSGIHKKTLHRLGGEAICYIGDEGVAALAKEKGVTRSAVSMEMAAKLDRPLIFAIGNAPTALVQLYEMIQNGKLKPELIIGVPVGFVNVVQSKELIMQTDVPVIVARGRKGGSNIAAAICNALLYKIDNDRE
ncbi:MAG: precorrin-8X methylmutase [Lachnospiraceae bacterium]|nr:precorrin-8X methylmutase [Lachnospiraceae bacterium]